MSVSIRASSPFPSTSAFERRRATASWATSPIRSCRSRSSRAAAARGRSSGSPIDSPARAGRRHLPRHAAGRRRVGRLPPARRRRDAAARARAAHLVPRLEHARRRRRAPPRRRRPPTPACWRATASATAPRPAATRPSASRPTASTATSPDATLQRLAHRASPPSGSPAGARARCRALLLRLRRAARRPARRGRAAGARRSRREAPGVRQLVTATTDPCARPHGRRLVDAPRRADARGARDHARARRRGLGLLLVLRDAGRARRSCSTSMPSPTSRSPRRRGCRAERGLLYWSVNDYTGDPYRDPLNHGEEHGRIEQRRRRAAVPGQAARPARPRIRPCASRSSPPACRSRTRRRCSRGAATATRPERCSRRVLPGTAEFVDNPAAWQAVERALLSAPGATS